ncbi:hypothetical protein [Kribbella sp. NPDC048928]|uniref:hypothetical protein n=1 Tax=Kribbella sp. NPDC048928 TaxID=3364111 RepID=UPI00371C74A6
MAKQILWRRIERMFEIDLDVLATRDLLEQAAECRAIANRSDARLLECAQVYADRYHPSNVEPRPARRSYDGRERAVVLGGDGCPEIAEFAIAEFAMVVGVSPGVGRDLLADALALRHRFPRIWARIRSGEATPWKARQIVRTCIRLHHEAAAYVDARVADVVDTISPYRLAEIVAAAKRAADPGLAAKDAAEAADKRGVFISRDDGHGNKTLCIVAPSASVDRLNAKFRDIAEALKSLGDLRLLQHRRAAAAEILSDPRFTLELLAQARHHTSPLTTPAPSTAPQSTTTPNPSPASGQRTESDQRTESEQRSGFESAGGASTDARTKSKPAPEHAPIPEAGVSTEAGASTDPGRAAKPQPAIAPDDPMEPDAEQDLLELAEPIGPPEDPWLEATGPYDPDPPTDPFKQYPPTNHPRPGACPGVHPDTETDLETDTETRSEDEPADGPAMDPAALRALAARLAQIKHDAYTNPTYTNPTHAHAHANADAGVGSGRERSRRARPGQTEVVVHLTDRTLATGVGVVRVEALGPLLASQLGELIGYGPYTVKPVIDLNDAVSVNAYEIPKRIRERVKYMYPVELFPYGTRETSDSIDLDHIKPYDPHGPAGQTSTDNLAPLGRFGHRVKTHAREWSVRRIDDKTLEWTTPHGFTFHVDSDGTHRVDRRPRRLRYIGRPSQEDTCRDS